MPKTLLLADDSVVIQKLVGLSFANEDVELTTTDNGDDAIARARELKPDLVLADVVMPGKNGYEVCEAIKADANLAHIPVLLLTGTFEAFDENRARSAGSDGHITKPFEAQALVDRVTELLANAPAPNAPIANTTPDLDGPAVTRIKAATEDDAFEFFDDGVQDLDATPAAATAPPPLAPSEPSPLAENVVPEARSPLPPLGGAEAEARPARPDETVALIPDAPGGTTPPIDDLAFEAATPAEAATTVDLGGPAAPAAEPAPVAALDDLLLDESPGWSDDLEIGTSAGGEASGASGLSDDLFDDAPAADAVDAPQPTALIMSEGESSSDSIAFGDAPQPRPSSENMQTMLADDLFGDAAVPPAAPAAAPVGDDALDSVDDLMGDVTGQAPSAPGSDVADEFDVSSSDLAQSIPAMPPLQSEPEPIAEAPAAPAPVAEAPPAPEPVAESQPEPAPIPEPEPVLEPALEPEPIGAPRPAASEEEAFSVSEGLLAGSPAEAEAPMAAAATDAPVADDAVHAGPDLTPIMHDRVHETLERVAWEAFSDLSDSVVKQVVEKVEQVAWEVIPQMAEAIIKEEIRRMKGETDE